MPKGTYYYKNLFARQSRNIHFFFVKTYYKALLPTECIELFPDTLEQNKKKKKCVFLLKGYQVVAKV